jgi:hypothetical protein
MNLRYLKKDLIWRTNANGGDKEKLEWIQKTFDDLGV